MINNAGKFSTNGFNCILHYDEDIQMWIASHNGIGGALVRGETKEAAIDNFVEAMMVSRECFTLMHSIINLN